jgi:hypothetical protein
LDNIVLWLIQEIHKDCQLINYIIWKKALEQCLFYFLFFEYAIGLWSIILCITSDDQLMKKLNDIACNLNWIQIQLKRMKCKLMQKVYWKNSCDFDVEKKKFS